MHHGRRRTRGQRLRRPVDGRQPARVALDQARTQQPLPGGQRGPIGQTPQADRGRQRLGHLAPCRAHATLHRQRRHEVGVRLQEVTRRVEGGLAVPRTVGLPHRPGRRQVVTRCRQRSPAAVVSTSQGDGPEVMNVAADPARRVPGTHGRRSAPARPTVPSTRRRATTRHGRAAEGDMAATVAHVVGARPNFMKAAPVIRALEAPRRPTAAHPHGSALRPGHVRRLLRRARPARAGHQPRGRLGQRTPCRPRRSWSRSTRSSTGRRRPSPSSTATSTRPSPPRIVVRQAADAARPRRGRAAQLRPVDAGGDQPAGHRPALRPAVRDQPGGRRQPAPRGPRPMPASSRSATR